MESWQLQQIAVRSLFVSVAYASFSSDVQHLQTPYGAADLRDYVPQPYSVV